MTASSDSPVGDRQLGLLDLPSVRELEACIRCGLCLSVCPTYQPTQIETKSPRGRIALVKNMVEGGLSPLDPGFAKHLDLCLQCMACQTVCPTGVSAGEVVARAKSYRRAVMRPRSAARLLHALVYRRLLPSYSAMQRAALPVRLYNRSGMQRLLRATGLVRLLPGALQRMEALLPGRIGPAAIPRLPAVTPSIGPLRAEIAFHVTCVNNVVLADATLASIRVLAHNGCMVCRAPGAVCCGAPHETEGDMETARVLARRNIAAYEAIGDCIVVSDAAACGHVMKSYARWLSGDPVWAERARKFSARVRDIHEFLIELGPVPPRGTVERTVTYADPCHLCHAQGIAAQPRSLLRMVPGLRLVELGDASWCCGSAGTYNIQQPEMADTILERKMDSIRASGASVVASANPGCLLQIEAGARKHRVTVRVLQVSQLLDESYRKANATAAQKEAGRER